MELSSRIRPATREDLSQLAGLARTVGLLAETADQTALRQGPYREYSVEAPSSGRPIAYGAVMPTQFQPVYLLELALGRRAFGGGIGDILLGRLLQDLLAVDARAVIVRLGRSQRPLAAFLSSRGFTALEPPSSGPADREFFEHLAHRRFPVTVWLRTPEEFDYIVEPDLFHDFFGHVPLLFDGVYAEHLQAYGRGGLKALPLGGLTYLARLYWYTIEFGLVRSPDGVRAYGAGLLSSAGELPYCIDSDTPRRIAFDPLRMMRTEYRIDAFQDIYFVIDDFEQLLRDTAPDFKPYYTRLRVEDRPGVIAQTTGSRLLLGELAGGSSPRMERLIELFRAAGLETELRTSIRVDLWEKFMGICSGSLTALTRLPIGPILACPELAELYRAVMVEVVGLASACGVEVPTDAVDRRMAALYELAPTLRTSQSYDLEAGRRLELDSLNGTVVRLGR